MICLISFNKFSDVLPAFTCASAIGNLCSICSGVNILSGLSKILVRPFPCFVFGNLSLSKALRTSFFPLGSIITFLTVSTFFILILLVLQIL